MNLLKRTRLKLSSYIWCIAYGKYDESILFEGLKWDKIHFINNPYKSKWFADPFILEEDTESIQFLVEEFDSKVGKGRIARLVVDKSCDTIVECHIVLEQSTHLSFPAIYRLGDDVFVHPENSASGKSMMYKYDRLSDRLIEPIVIIDNPLTDAIITFDKEIRKYLMFSTKQPDAAGPLLYKYESTTLMGPYNEVAVYNYRQATARMAGGFITSSRGMIRPAQDCIHDYGEAVLLYNSENIVVGELRPKGWIYEGLHTFNVYGDTYVIDLKHFKRAFLHYNIKRLKRLLVR